MKSGNLNFLELSGPLQACNGTAVPFAGHYKMITGELEGYSNDLARQNSLSFKK
jgi:hypothetical protein